MKVIIFLFVCLLFANVSANHFGVKAGGNLSMLQYVWQDRSVDYERFLFGLHTGLIAQKKISEKNYLEMQMNYMQRGSNDLRSYSFYNILSGYTTKSGYYRTRLHYLSIPFIIGHDSKWISLFAGAEANYLLFAKCQSEYDDGDFRITGPSGWSHSAESFNKIIPSVLIGTRYYSKSNKLRYFAECEFNTSIMNITKSKTNTTQSISIQLAVGLLL